MVDPYLVRLQFVKTLIDKGYFGKEKDIMSGRIEKVQDVQQAMEYFSVMAGICADALNGKSLAKACGERGVSPLKFNNMIHNRIPTYILKDRVNADPDKKYDIKSFLSWQELLWLDIFGEKDYSLIPPDVDEAVDAALKDTYITKRERTVIFMRYKEQMTLDECGKHFNISRDRIRQIEAKALRKLRMPRRSYWMRYGKVAREKLDRLQYIRNALVVSEKIKDLDNQINEALTHNDIQRLLDLKNKLALHLAEYNVAENSDPDVLDIPIEELELSVRSYNCLRRHGDNTVGDICKMSYDELISVRNLGRRSCAEIIDKLHSLGVDLREVE